MKPEVPKLPRRPLGQTGLLASCLGLGTVKFGRNTAVKYPRSFDLPDTASMRRLLDLARELGINLLDTAPAYGSSEERLGQVLDDRHDWILCSKTGEEFENGASRFDFSAAHTRFSVERSLRRLRTDYLDMVMVHSDGNDRQIIEQSDCIETLQRCRESGLIRSIGFSGKTAAGGLLALEYCEAVMVSYNPSQTGEEAVINSAGEMGKAVLIKKALNSGHLSTLENPVERAMSFIFSHPAVTSVISGTLNPKHLQQNAAAVRAALDAEQSDSD